jgi:hypothetical protein
LSTSLLPFILLRILQTKNIATWFVSLTFAAILRAVDLLTPCFPDKRYTDPQLDTIVSIIQFASGNQDVLAMHAGLAWGINKFQIAYILATAEWESSFSPIEEIGGRNKPYAPYYGRGYVQLTHRGELPPFGRTQPIMLTSFA